MSRTRVFHRCPRHNFIGLLIYDKGLRAVDALDVVLSLLTTDDENLILGLDGREISRQLVSVPQLDAFCRLAR